MNSSSLDVFSIAHARSLRAFLLPKLKTTKVARAGLPAWPEVEDKGEKVGVKDESNGPFEETKMRDVVSRDRRKGSRRFERKKTLTFAYSCGSSDSLASCHSGRSAFFVNNVCVVSKKETGSEGDASGESTMKTRGKETHALRTASRVLRR